MLSHPHRDVRFLHIIGDSSQRPHGDDSSFLYLSVTEFHALQKRAQETLRQPVQLSTFNASMQPLSVLLLL